MGGGVRHDYDVSARRSLHDHLADQFADVFAARSRDGWRRAAHRPRLAATLRKCFEHARDKRLPPLRVRNVSGVDPSFRRNSGDDLLVDIEKAEALGDKSTDL